MIFGLIVCLVAAVAATFLAGLQHWVGGPMLGLVIGILLANLLPSAFVGKCKKGAAFSSKVILRAGIIITGGTLSFSTIVGAGSSALPYIILSIIFAFITACLVGKYLIPVTTNTRILVAGGTSICGGTAIATLAGVINADEDEMAYAMAAIFLFDLFATLIWPYVALGMDFSPEQFSVLAGIAINDVASVTAAGATFDSLMGAAALSADGVTTGGELAVVVKLTRVVMLVFVALAVMVWSIWSKGKTEESQGEKSAVSKIISAFPVFILGFLALAVVNTLVDFSGIALFGTTLAKLMKTVSKFCITMALVGVGAKINLKDMLTKGIKPVLLGGCTWIIVAVFTFSYVCFFM